MFLLEEKELNSFINDGSQLNCYFPPCIKHCLFQSNYNKAPNVNMEQRMFSIMFNFLLPIYARWKIFKDLFWSNTLQLLLI